MTSTLRSVKRNFVRALFLVGILILSGCRNNGMNGGSGDPSGSADSGGANAPSGNNAPTISGTPPPSVTIGEAYSFEPGASDPDGDALTFSIEGKPAWADFDTATGALSGTPQSGDEGPYDISIEVSDGMLSDALGFAVTVNQIALGSVTLSWTAPTLNTDGSPLEDLAAYRIYYGVTEGTYTHQIDIDGAGVTTCVVDNLSPDTWYFVVTALNGIGVESEFSGVATTTVD